MMARHDEELARDDKCPCWVCMELRHEVQPSDFVERCVAASTECNRCALDRIRARARRKGKMVTLMSSQWQVGGYEIYVHSRNINVRMLKPAQRKLYWRTWMLQIGRECVCKRVTSRQK
jgi:hypothetical protein